MKNRKKEDQKRKHRKKPRYWILSATTVGILVAYTVGASRALNVAHFKNQLPNAESFYRRTIKNTVQKFNIPAGTLAEVLETFEKQTGWRVQIPPELRQINSRGVAGEYSEERALELILENTGVVYKITAPRNIVLKIEAATETVQIAVERITLSSAKYTEPLRDTPQTITVIDKDVIEQQGATTLRDVLRNVPGLTVTAGEGGNAAGDNLTLRGFSARNDIYVDGARDLSPQNRDPFNLEQVEVVKGPSSATTGRGSTGGTVNLITKAPNFKPSYNFDLTGGTDQTKRITGDINIPLERFKDGSQNSFRVNFVGHDSNYAGREIVANTRYGIAPTLLLGLGDKTTLTLAYFFLGQENTPDYGIPFVPATNKILIAYRDRIAPVSRGTYYGMLNRDKEFLRSHLGTITLNHAIDDNANVRNQFRYDHSSRDSITSTPRFNNDNSGTLLNRELKAWLTTDQNYDNQTDFTARFKTGFIEHAIVAGSEFIFENSRRFTRSGANSLTNLYDPNPRDVYANGIFTNYFPGIVRAATQAFYGFDTLKLHPKFELSGGLRYERFHAKGNLPPVIILPTATTRVVLGTIGTRVDNADNLFNIRAAAIYKPVQSGSFYVSYGTSSNPSLSGLIYENATVASLDPERTKTYEAGTKWDLFKNRLLAAAAVFNVEKINARTPQPDGTLQILDGIQRVRGIEIGLTGNVTNRWSILSGYTLLDSRIVRSNAFATVGGVKIYEVGHHFINTPRNSFNLWSTYRLPFAVNIGGGGQYVGMRYVNTINTRQVDAYWLFNATASYALNKHVEFRLNANNLADKFYIGSFSGGHAVPGPGRSLLFSTGFRF